MHRRIAVAASAVLLAGPTVLAFFSGGYFDGPRAWAGLGAWLLVVVGLLTAGRARTGGRGAQLGLGRGGALTVGALGLLAAWTLLSTTWAPIAGSAYHAGQIAVLYLGTVLAGALLLRGRAIAGAVEPALVLGAAIVVGYGVSERLLPGVLHFSRSISAGGRLEQPLTYWNAMGQLAAIGFVLAARIAGDAARAAWLRASAIAAAVVLGLGLYLSFSRGALFACGAGLVALVVLAPSRETLRSGALAVGAAAAAALVAAPSGGVTSLSGALPTRERQGAITLAVVAVIIALAVTLQWRLSRTQRSHPLRLPRHAGWIALVAICGGLALAIAVGANESSKQRVGNGAARLATLESNRYAYWRVALRAFSDEPLRGVGAGGWAVDWLRYRTVDEFAQDAHSLELQTLAELGLIGALLLLGFFAGIALSARDAVRAAPARAAGAVAGVVVWVAHSPLDWDWQMPAVTLVAMVLCGFVIAAGSGDAVGWHARE